MGMALGESIHHWCNIVTKMYKEALGYGPIQPLKQLNTAWTNRRHMMLESILHHSTSVLSRWQ